MMALFLITSVCQDGVDESSFRVVEAESPLAITQAMLDDPYAWESLLRNTELWWDLTRYEYTYNEPLGWSAEELLDKIDATWMDGDSRNQVRIHEIREIERILAPSSEKAVSLS
ncbi:MAG TPA: hypothetical protein VFB21_05310 [Chthonomonadaceae bacterium]|nr:hypothetical protein [Chthonomonadaceae bacterium]